VLERANGLKSARLSDRSWEVSPDGLTVFKEGDKRSMKKMKLNDMYLMGGITITYVIPNAGMRCPRF
jgi:hypothetical protein